MCCPFEMTAKYENPKDAETNHLEEILRKVKSIDSRVEDILDNMNDHIPEDDYDPFWDQDKYFNNY